MNNQSHESEEDLLDSIITKEMIHLLQQYPPPTISQIRSSWERVEQMLNNKP
jgi:hypothetical protein